MYIQDIQRMFIALYASSSVSTTLQKVRSLSNHDEQILDIKYSVILSHCIKSHTQTYYMIQMLK